MPSAGSWADGKSRWKRVEAYNAPSGFKLLQAYSRVLRGGAFNNEPRNLRSANRNRNNPENRNQNIGFRCARGPRRQHAAGKAPCRV